MNNQKQIILFDGVCNFCNYWVDFVIRRDKKDLFRFASLQSSQANELTKKFNFDSTSLDTFVLIAKDKLYTKSTAALTVCKSLSSPIKILYPLIFLPKSLRDFIYDFIARYRYKIFGKKMTCRIPTEAEKSKFI